MRHLLLAALLCLMLAACAPAAAPDAPPAEGVTPTPLPTPGGWARATEPVSLTNAGRLRQLGTLTVPEPPSTVFAHALALDNTRLYGLNNDYLIGWDLLTGEQLFANPREGAVGVYASPDRRRVYTLGADGLIRVYNADDGAAVENFRGMVEFNGVAAYDPLGGFMALGGSDGAVQLWDLPSRTAVAMLRGTRAALSALAFSPDGFTLLTSDVNGTLTAWDTETYDSTGSLDLLIPVYRLLFSPSGEAVVVDTPQGTLVVAADGLTVVDSITTQPSAGVLTFVGDTEVLAHGGGELELTLWDTIQVSLAATLPGFTGERVSVAAPSDGQLLFTNVLGTGAGIWNLSNLADGSALRGALRIDDAQLREVAWTPDGFQLLFFTVRGPVVVWGVGG